MGKLRKCFLFLIWAPKVLVYPKRAQIFLTLTFIFYRKIGVPEAIRTPDLRLRRATLYPAELRALCLETCTKPQSQVQSKNRENCSAAIS